MPNTHLEIKLCSHPFIQTGTKNNADSVKTMMEKMRSDKKTPNMMEPSRKCLHVPAIGRAKKIIDSMFILTSKLQILIEIVEMLNIQCHSDTTSKNYHYFQSEVQ